MRAFNDNAWKLMVALLAIRQVTAAVGASGPAFEAASQAQATIAFVVFNLPLMLFSVVAGVLSDRLSKRTVIITFKMVEIALMGAGTVALWRDPTGGWPALVVLGAMGVHSAFFSPAKYGILPDHLTREELPSGNALVESATFLAILTGAIAGGVVALANSHGGGDGTHKRKTPAHSGGVMKKGRSSGPAYGARWQFKIE